MEIIQQRDSTQPTPSPGAGEGISAAESRDFLLQLPVGGSLAPRTLCRVSGGDHLLPGLGGGPSGGGRRASSLASFPSHTQGKILTFKGQGVGHMTEYMGTLRSSLVPQGMALPQILELLLPAYSHIRPLSGMAMGSRWHQLDGCLSREREKHLTRIHKAGHHLTARSQDVQLLVLEGRWIRGSRAGDDWGVGCRA